GRALIMHDEYTDQLSDYLDGELSAAESAAVEAHLRECAACVEVLNDLKRIVAQAKELDARPPRADLWGPIAARIDRIVQARRVARTVPELGAAAVLLMALSGTIVWQAAQRSASRSAANAALRSPDGASSEAARATAVDAQAPRDDASIDRSDGGARALPVS